MIIQYIEIYCTLWIREAVVPNWGFWGNLGSGAQYLIQYPPPPCPTNNLVPNYYGPNGKCSLDAPFGAGDNIVKQR